MNILALDENLIEQYKEYIPEDLAEDLERNFFHGLIAVSDGSPVGGIIWEVRNVVTSEEMEKESSIHWIRLEDQDAARSLFEFYKLSIDIDDVVKSVYTLPARDFQEGKVALLEAGFTVDLMEGDVIRATLSDIMALPIFKKIKPQDDIKTLYTLSQSGFNVAIRRFAERGNKGICEDLEYLPREYFDNYVSCYCQMDDMINGILLFHAKQPGELQIVLMSAIGEESQRIVAQMMSYALACAKPLYKPSTQICIERHNYMTLALSEKLFPSGFGIPVYTGSRQER